MPVDGPASRAPWTFNGPSEQIDLFSLASKAVTPVAPGAPLAPGLHDIEVDKIVVPSDRRELVGSVDLTESISAVGLINPLTVTPSFRLVAGWRRLKAVRELGWATVPCIVVDLDGLKADLTEIDENLVRNEPNALERAELLRRRKETYEELYPDTKRGVSGGKARQGSASENISFAADTAAKTGLTPRCVQMDVKLDVDLDEEAKNALRSTPAANNKSALKSLAKQEPAVQRSAARKLQSGEAKSLAEAIQQTQQEQGEITAVPMDELGSVLPDRLELRQAFDAGPSFRRVLNLQARLTSALKALFDESGYGAACIRDVRQRIESHRREAEMLVRDHQPHAVCPECRGSPIHCGRCKSRGWLTRADWARHVDAGKE
jgi:hypothetical protein